MPHLVFVFGTLKEGYPNFATNRGRRVAGDFITVERYPLYLVGERFSPWLVYLAGEGERVIGQLFEVDDATLAAMDILERVAQADGYRRVPIDVEEVSQREHAGREPGGARGTRGACGTRAVHAYVKAPEHFDAAQAKGGPLREYTMAHAALYRSRASLA